MAAQAESELTTEIETSGRLSVVDKAAKRLEVVARLYYGAFSKAMTEGDLEHATALLKVYGWIQNSSIRALLALDEADRRQPRTNQNYIEVPDSETKPTDHE